MALIIWITLSLLILPRIILIASTISAIFPEKQCPPNRYAVVFGAGLEKSGRPTRVLRERVETAVGLLRRGNVTAIILSGGNRSVYANETEAMRLYALELGTPAERLIIDPDGFRSFESCVNLLKYKSNQFTLVTQRFHLPRVVWIARRLGMNAVGCIVPHDIEHWDDFIWWQIRELPASLLAFRDILRFKLKR